MKKVSIKEFWYTLFYVETRYKRKYMCIQSFMQKKYNAVKSEMNEVSNYRGRVGRNAMEVVGEWKQGGRREENTLWCAFWTH